MKHLGILLISILLPALFFSLVAKAEEITEMDRMITDGKIQAVMENNEDEARAIKIVEQARSLKRDIYLNQVGIFLSNKFNQDIQTKAHTLNEEAVLIMDQLEEKTLTLAAAQKALNELQDINCKLQEMIGFKN